MFGSSRSTASSDKADDDPGVRRNPKGRALLDLHYDEYNTKIYPSGSDRADIHFRRNMTSPKTSSTSSDEVDSELELSEGSESTGVRLPSTPSTVSSDEETKRTTLESQQEFRPNRDFVETNQPTGSDSTRREENPFSFKHFLRNDSQSNYQYAGARPKVYTDHPKNNESSSHEREGGVYPCNPTELPDFVQDHLVIEQCYVDRDRITSPVTHVYNLPDFALNSMMEKRQNRQSNESKRHQGEGDISFPYLPDYSERRNRNPVLSNSPHSDPLDLPNFNCNENASGSDSRNFPFDLQMTPVESHNLLANGACNGASNIVKSLPDFLSDGPILNRGTVSNDRLFTYFNDSSEYRLILENERLHHELEIARRQANERALRIQSLENQLLSRRQEDHEETVNLEKAMEKVEDNLKRSTRRAVNAESMVASLKKEVTEMNNEISMLRLENRELRAAVGEGSNNSNSACVDERIKRLASDLRTSASSAEVSLRQLLSGVENLRILASTLENVDRIEDRTKDFLPDSDDDNATGPAV